MSQQKIVYFVRHGESDGNRMPVIQSYDSPLSSDGVKQAKLVGQRLREIDFDVLISSPQPRALQTADAISRATGKAVQTSDLFIERRKPSSIDGKPWTDDTAAATWRHWEASLLDPMLKVEDGENYTEIRSRVNAALAYLETIPETKIVVVTHSHFMRSILAHVLLGEYTTGKLLRRFYDLISIENTGITVLKYRDAFEEDFCWRLWTLNDYSHLSGTA